MTNTERVIHEWLSERFEVGDEIEVFDDVGYDYGIYRVMFTENDGEECFFLADSEYVHNTYSLFFILFSLINDDLRYKITKDEEE